MFDNYSANGLCLAALSSFVFAVASLIAKYLNHVNPLQLALFSFIGIFVTSLILFNEKSNEITLTKRQRLLLILRSLCGATFFILSFTAVQLMPLGDASVLFFTAPIYTLALARWFLKEPCTCSTLIAGIFAILGVIFVTQPPFIFRDDENNSEQSPEYFLGALCATGASFSEAIGNVAVRSLQNVDVATVLLIYGFITSVVTFIVTIVVPGTWNYYPTLNDFFPIFFLIIFTCFEQFLMTMALSVEHAGPVSLVQAADIIYGYIFEVIFFGEKISGYSIFGAAIVTTMIIYMLTIKKHSTSNSSVIV